MAFGVSNSFRRGTVKTYTKQRASIESTCTTKRPCKRIRMDTTGTAIVEHIGAPEDAEAGEGGTVDAAGVQAKSSEAHPSSVSDPSSPSATERVLFSSNALQDVDCELSSPPSSPPPLPSPRLVLRKPAFAFLKRKRSSIDDGSQSEPLSNLAPNARKMPSVTKKAMTQMQIDLGGEVRKTCRTCGMEYIPAIKGDSALHSKYCAMDVGGVDMGKAFLKDNSVKMIQLERASGNERERVVTVDRKSSLAAKNRVKNVLGVVNAELSSADIKDDYLWGALDPEMKVIETRKGRVELPDKRGDRFKAFLHMVDEKCVGFCLTEKINGAFPVIRSQAGEDQENQVLLKTKSSSITVSTTADVALLGISRIWVSKSHRGRGLAVDLLDCARTNFFYGVEAPKNLVAFSQPTESGGRLAERWFGGGIGWHVYRGDE